ncbi:MAG: aldo/keto reductase [Eubacteriales bacterium]|nr:aldo/keto reductase [Eubacteriales bacterium]MDD3537801.1 aldo/keto reductase [Eubacteriales bacterium]MDD4018517.1 aldo/keto reductase [Kiritimatiellia bacterium]
MPNGPVAVRAVREALSAGYRHIDTAALYGNEESVGRALRESEQDRETIFVTSKLRNTEHGYEATLAAFDRSMKRLGFDYLDLYLIHTPHPKQHMDRWQEVNAGSWKAFEELYEASRIRSIGVSNFMPEHLDALLETAKIMPMVNQIRLFPGVTQDETVQYCRQRNILLQAYSPLGTGKVFAMPEMKPLAAKYDRTVAQICLRWSLQMGFLPLPKSANPYRIRENAALFDFELSAEDVAALAALPT